MQQGPPGLHRSRIICALIALAPLLYGVTMLACSVNVPVGDDYLLLGDIVHYFALPDAGSKASLLFSFHNEHRIFTTRALMLLSARLAGSVDFQFLLVTANSAYLVAVALLGFLAGCRKNTATWAVLFLIALQPQPMKLMQYPMSGVQAYCGLLFSCAYLYCVLRRKHWLLWAALYLLTAVTTGSGLLLVLLGLPVLVHRRQWKEAMLHAACSVIAFVLYSPQATAMTHLLENPLKTAGFFLLLLGNVAQLPFAGSPYAQAAAGVLFLCYAAYCCWEYAVKTSPDEAGCRLARIACLAYLLLAIALIAAGRTALYEHKLWAASLDGRYRMYSMLFLGICCGDLLGRMARPWQTLVLGLALVFNVLWYLHAFPEMRHIASSRTHSLSHWLRTGDIRTLPILGCPPKVAQANLSAACAQGIFKPSLNAETRRADHGAQAP